MYCSTRPHSSDAIRQPADGLAPRVRVPLWRPQGTVLGQMSPLMDALQAVGAPGRFEPPLRPSQDTLLRLCVVAFRAALETASGEAVPGPVDEAAFEVLADAISPAPGGEDPPPPL